MPSSFDMQPVKLTNDPTQRMNYEPGKFKIPGPIDVLEQWVEAFGEFIGPIIKDATGLDFFHGPEEFLVSLVQVLTTGGPSIENLGNVLIDILSNILSIGPLQEIIPAIFAAFEGIAMAPGAILNDIQNFLNGLFNGNAIEGNQFPPYDVPFTPGAGSAMTDAQRFIANLKSFLSFDFLAVNFNPADAVSHFVEAVMGIPALIRQAFTDLVNLLVNVLDSIPFIGPPLGNALEDLAAMFGLIRTRTQVSQGSADTANVGVAILNARINDIVTGGASFYDTFGRDLSDFSTDPDYDVIVSGGSGNPYLTASNEGRLRWNAVGYSDTNFIARQKTTPMSTNRVRVSVVIDDFTYGFAGNQAHIWLMARMDATRQNYILGVVEDGAAEIGYVKAGVYTRLGATESVSTSTGDLWDLEVGSGSDEWRFRLVQNNSVRVDRTDLGHLSMKDTTPGTTYKYLGIGGDCAIGAGPFGTTYQIGMPDFQVIAGGDF